MYYFFFFFLASVPAWRLINVSVLRNGGFLPVNILLTQCYYHRGTRLNTMKRFCICSLWQSHLTANRFDIFSPEWGMLRRSRCVQFRYLYVVVVVVVFTLTDRASTIPSNIRGCQSGTWSQRGAKVNGSHHGDNPLLRQTGIQIATKSYATLKAMAPTNSKTVHQTSFTPYREQPRSTRIVVAYPRPAFSATNRTNTFQPVLINNSKFLKAAHRTKIRKIEIPRSMVVEALSC